MESDDWSVYRSVETETGRGGKGRMDTPPRILPSIHEDDKKYVWGRSKKKRKMKQQVLGENWGLEEEDNIKTMKEDDRNQDTKGEEARLNVEDMTLKDSNTSLAAKGALAYRLQRLQNPKWPPGGPEMADGVWKGVYL